MTTATFSNLSHTMSGALPRVDTDLLQTAAAVVSAIGASAFVLAILASAQAGI
jgi:hypothetical protein